MFASLFLAAALVVPEPALKEAFAGKKGAFVMIDCATGETFRSDAAACAEKLPPCSTFKIWNSAIGLETGVIKGPDELFWKWDGKKGFLGSWDKDQTLRSAFAVSCVPAYQSLARKIGQEQMQQWIDKIGYGNRDTSSGLDVFWLPAQGRKPLLISPDEQAEIVCQLVQGKLAFSPRTLSILKDVMQVKKTDLGTLYGKTGTGNNDGRGREGVYNIGWFVGYVESGGRTYAFATVLREDGVMGKDARAVCERILEGMKLL